MAKHWLLLALLLLASQPGWGSVLPAEGGGSLHAAEAHAGGNAIDHASGNAINHASGNAGDHADGHDGGKSHWEEKKWKLARKMDEITEKLTLFKLNFIAKKLEKFLPAQPGHDIYVPIPVIF